MSRDSEHALEGGDARSFNLAVFHQAAWWVQPDGSVHALKQMSRSERRALLRWLRDHAEHFYLQAVKAELVTCILAWQDGDAHGNWQSSLFAESNLLYRGAREWLEDTVLVRELRRG